MADKISTKFCECLKKVKVKWVIENFLDLPFETGQKLDSPDFHFNNSCWRILLYPKGNHTDNSKSISLGLYRVNVRGECRVEFSMEIVSGALNKKLELTCTFNETSVSDWGWPGFIAISEVRESLQSSDGVVTIFCEVQSITDDPSIVNADLQASRLENGAFENLSKSLEKLLLDRIHADVKLRVRGQEFSANKAVLSSRSPVFSAMFQHEMEENNTGTVEVNDLNPESFQDFLLFVYTAKFDCVQPENVLDLYLAADKYDLKDLKEECVFKMGNNLSSDTILDFYLLAEKYNEESLLKVSTNYFIENAETIWETDKWEDFFLENTKIAKKLMLKTLKRDKSS